MAQANCENDQRTLYCARIPPLMYSQLALQQHFGRFGGIQSIYISPNPEKKFAFVEFSTKETANAALRGGASVGLFPPLLLNWYQNKSAGHNVNKVKVQLCSFKLEADNDILEYVRRSDHYLELRSHWFGKFARIELTGKNPDILAEIQPVLKESKDDCQLHQQDFEKECDQRFREFLSKFSSSERQFDKEQLKSVRAQRGWNKFNEQITISHRENQFSVFARWDCLGPGKVKLVGLAVDVEAAMIWLKNQCRLKSSPQAGSSSSRRSEVQRESNLAISPCSSLHQFNHILYFDNDVIEFIRRSKEHMTSLKTELKTLANVDISGKSPKVEAQFWPQHTTNVIDQMDFEVKCKQKINSFFAKFCFQIRNFDVAKLCSIRSKHEWTRFNSLLTIAINENSEVVVFVRWDHLIKGGVKVIGLLEDAVAAMTWLQHQCDSSLEVIVPKGESSRTRRSSGSSGNMTLHSTVEGSPGTSGSSQHFREFEHQLEYDHDVVEFIRQSPDHLADLNNNIFKDLAQVTIVGKSPDMKTHFKPTLSSNVGLTDQRSFENRCIQKIDKFCKKFDSNQEIHEVDCLDVIRKENKWKKYNEKIKVDVSADKSVLVYVRWNNPQPGHTKLVGLSKDVAAVSQWLQCRCSSTTEKMSLSKTQIEILEMFGILSELKITCNASFEINKEQKFITFGGSHKDVLECQRKFTEKLKVAFDHLSLRDDTIERFLKRALDPAVKCEVNLAETIRKDFQTKNIKAVLEYRRGELIAWYDKQQDLFKASKSLKTLIDSCIISLTKLCNKQLFQTPEWRKLRGNLWTVGAIFISFTFTEEEARMSLVGLKPNLGKGRKLIEDFIKEHCSKEVVVELDYPSALFLKVFAKDNGLMSKLNDLDWKLSKEKSGIVLKGQWSRTKEAAIAIKNAKRSIIRHDISIDEVGMADYLRGDKGKQFLRATQNITKCILLVDTDIWQQRSISARQLVEAQLPGTNVSVKVIEGDITELHCDAIVNCSNEQLELRPAGVSGSILSKCGRSLQIELNQHKQRIHEMDFKDGLKKTWTKTRLKPGLAVTTCASSLPCNKIIHVVGPIWRHSNSATASHCLKDCIQSCLKEAETHKLNSIALPAISCGVFGGKARICVPIIVKAVEEYFQQNDSCIRTVHLIEFTNQEILCCFKDELDRVTSRNTDQREKQASTYVRLPITATSSLKYIDGALVVKVIQEDILKSNCDAIAIPQGGQISKQLFAQTGLSVKDKDKSSSSNKSSNYSVTSGGALPCKNIFHVVTPGSAAETEQVFVAVLQEAENLMRVSLAFAAIGTGNAGLDCAAVSISMQKAINQFKRSKPVYLKRIEIVICDSVIMSVFQIAMSGLNNTSQAENAADWNLLGADSTDGQQELSTNRQSLILEKQQISEGESIKVFLCSNQRARINQASKKILEHVKEMSITKSIEDIVLASFEDEKELLALESKHGVLIRRLSSGSGDGKLQISGLKENVIEAYAAALEMIRQTKEIHICAEYVTWQYRDPHNNKKRNFASKHNWQIENDHKKNNQGQTTIQVEAEGKSLTFVIDFASMKETCSNTNTMIDVYRSLRSEKKEYPSCWTHMDNKLVLVETLKIDSSEYVDVQQQVLMSAKGLISNIIKIERIQNPTLYDQFLAQKNRVECRMRKLGSHDRVTRELFHGTCGEVCENIFKHGFDRSHAGKNATLYGRGVYFAIESSYSHGYTTKDSSHTRKMFLADVITGQYCSGHSLLVTPPVIPGSNNDPYDSTVNNTSTPSIFVVFKDASVYPLYLVTYA
ncbi:uncharacterized protein LOC143463875 isoform X3 [Clavelina lepadiformis]|uniref:uncharacterized protein LOC143463875 isoform X3 n=1 Tax=Clavelina lepadiformis TaxID=159417 RepID=UPI0040431E83